MHFIHFDRPGDRMIATLAGGDEEKEKKEEPPGLQSG